MVKLLNPIEPEEFEGDEEEWEKMLDDVEELPDELEKPEIYTGGKTDRKGIRIAIKRSNE